MFEIKAKTFNPRTPFWWLWISSFMSIAPANTRDFSCVSSSPADSVKVNMQKKNRMVRFLENFLEQKKEAFSLFPEYLLRRTNDWSYENAAANFFSSNLTRFC